MGVAVVFTYTVKVTLGISRKRRGGRSRRRTSRSSYTGTETC